MFVPENSVHTMFEKQIEAYETLRKEYNQWVTLRMNREDLKEYNEVLFSAHSCAIEGNSFSVNDTRELKEKGLGVIPQGKTLFEAFEMLDHFNAYEYLFAQPSQPLTEEMLKETHRILMLHTIAYKYPGAQAGEYTDTDMAAGDTLFGDHEQLIARVPQLLRSTQSALEANQVHPMIIAARFHGLGLRVQQRFGFFFRADFIVLLVAVPALQLDDSLLLHVPDAAAELTGYDVHGLSQFSCGELHLTGFHAH